MNPLLYLAELPRNVRTPYTCLCKHATVFFDGKVQKRACNTYTARLMFISSTANTRAHEVILSQARLKEVLRYDEVKGEFTWLVKPNRRVLIGSKAGSKSGQYTQIRIDGKGYYAHRLAWLYMTGVLSDEVDHENRIGTDNRWLNLRLATRSQNQCNTGLSSANTSGVKGVSWDGRDQRWVGKVKKNGRVHLAGRFRIFEDAVKAVRELRLKLHGEFGNG